MPNKIEKVQILQKKLDKKIVQELTTGWMEVNANQVQYTGGEEVKIPQLLVDGLGNYDKGYKDGYVDFRFVTKKLTQDRGVRFNLDVRDVDETAGILNMGAVMQEFQRTQVVPEIDAYRLSFLATEALKHDGQHETYTPDNNVLKHIKDGIKALRKAGHQGEIVIHANYDVITELEMLKPVVANTVTFTANGISTQVNQVDNCPIIPTAQNRMVSKIELFDGSTKFGFDKASDAQDLNFIIVARKAPIAITKLDTIRVFDPMTNQAANGWMADYRRFHDIWVLPSMESGVFVSVKG